MSERSWPRWVVLGIGVAVAAVSVAVVEPPPAEPVDAPRTVFSADRAMAHVEAIARLPHPIGSDENRRVREVILARLRAIDIEPEVQAPRDEKRPERNILARLKGRGTVGKKAILLCAHYDSVDEGPGAGDDASGVAAILETLRAINAGPPLGADVIALIDDGEEYGLLGATTFVNEHPWAKEVGVVLNLDARGTRGPSFMFETSEKNGWLVRRFAEVAPHPLATSISMDVYRLIRNDTDLSVFKRAGYAGINFAFNRGLGDYHTPLDSVSRLDPRALQHQGENALALARHLARFDLENVEAEDVVYFSILNRFTLSYPISLAVPCSYLPTAAWLMAVVLGMARRRVKLGEVLVGSIAWPMALATSIFVAGGAWLVVREQFQTLGVGPVEFMIPILSGLGLIATGTTVFVERRASKGRSLDSMALGALAWWVVLALLCSRFLPGISYLFTWATLASCLGLMLGMLMPRGSFLAAESALLGCVPALILMPPLIRELFEGLGLQYAALSMIPVVLFVGGVLALFGPIIGEGGGALTSTEGGPTDRR